jgi:hypothetical protein
MKQTGNHTKMPTLNHAIEKDDESDCENEGEAKYD